MFVKPGTERYATDEQLLGERELRAAAVRRGAPAWTTEQADDLLARFSRSGRTLGADQEAALRGILTSGAAVELLMAPAGTGKSFLVGTLADSWGGPPGAGEERERRVFGLAYGQRQADVLGDEGVTSRNIRRWLDGQARLDAGTAGGDDEAFRLRSGDLVVVDEAGAASTPALVAIHRRCAQAGAKLLLVGDPKQLAAVGAGGAMADIAERGIRYELAEVRRFRNSWEGPASLRLRDGDETVVAEYAKQGRLVDGGTPEQAEAAAARAWLAATLDGRDALLVVGSNAAAARVSNALRSELVRLGRVEERGVPLGMQGTYAGVGDLVQARRNAWHLDGWQGNTAAPINRTVYRVTALAPDGGGLTVARVTGRDADGAEQLGEPLHLPAGYVNEHVTLAYASTVHAAHGRTVQDGIGVLAPGTDAEAAYVQATRGTDTNMLFAVTRNVSDSAATGETFGVAERGAATVLADVIRPPDEDRNRTALAEAEAAADRARSTATQIDPLLTVLGDALGGRTGRWLDELAAAGVLPERHRVAFAADEARESLDQLLRAAELAGHDARQVLADAVTATSLDGSTSVAQVLHFRVRSALEGKLTPRVDSYRDLLPTDLPADTRTGLLALADAADTRRAELVADLAFAPPTWVTEALGPVPDEPGERAAWVDKAGWAASYRELGDHTDAEDPLGAAPARGLAEKHALFHTAHTALDLATAGDEEERMSEGRLRARIAAWEREKSWAPDYVADRLEATHSALRAARENATVWSARADAEPDPLEADQLRGAAEQSHKRVAELEHQLDDLQFADDARAAWRYETAVTKDNAERARHAAAVRGIDLDNPAEQITAEEWLNEHRAAQFAEDEHREITEHDVDDAANDVTVVQPPVDDVETTKQRSRPADATAEVVDRASLAFSTIEQRHDDAVDRDVSDGDTRQAELAQWAEDDAQDASSRSSGPGLGRTG
ncbi:ATP-dependent DNA helicase [Pseudonocardia xinjiangensis]|uniref:AAA family ATPase n=1 Tax=Pseudonocardia xinjiangensis TaxID=75289 RepID=A0ABX1RHE6_9PSEU|nr:AAA family ATPase [Pseudonocardia xinjiangensis]NMH79813.1 AAA family ATPase [Pseudonocardia xinjiangensis]